MFKKREEYMGPVDQFGRPINVSQSPDVSDDDRRLGMIFFTVLGILVIVILVIVFVINYLNQNRLEIPKATLSTEEWTKDSVVVTVDKSRGNAYEFSFDGGKTWQQSNQFEVFENQELSIQVRNEKGKVSKKASVIVSNIDKKEPDLYFIDSYIVAVGNQFDPRENVTAADSDSGIDEYRIDTSTLDLTTPGEYLISYYLSDMVGNEVTKTRKIVVEPTLSEYRYRSRKFDVVESECSSACNCSRSTQDGMCPSGTSFDPESGRCCETCLESCFKTEYGEWSKWQEEKILPTRELEVQMTTQAILNQLALEQQSVPVE